MIDTSFLLLRPDGTSEQHSAAMQAKPGLDELRRVIGPLLDGSPLEHVSVLHQGRRTDMFVDECGAINGLPRNEAATAIYRSWWLSQHPDADPESMPAIYGPAVLFDRIVWS